ncbi:unnamed protein product [Urochloa decumbens]|uniref:DUF4283 domain-containing protein n=1 Tax=Urochloa decumbens TaxID=240449 RepID=A0ABC8Z1I6_9POAL
MTEDHSKQIGEDARSRVKLKMVDDGEGGAPTQYDEVHAKNMPRKVGCNICGLKNHVAEECRRRMLCEICGFTNHNTYDCKREPLWNMGPELCAAQVIDQSFFYIDEHIDHKAARDKASTAIITVLKGEITARQIEAEFRNIVSSSVWKWSARKITNNKFTMRFPSTKMVQDYSRFSLGIRGVDAQIEVSPWNSAIGAKGRLQMGWFRVSGIPVDQRSIKTIAKVGGLVGKTVAIDESTRFKPEYVRMQIACRDLKEVPASAEGTLGLNIFDFYFVLEEQKENPSEKLKAAVPVGEQDAQPNLKKPRTEESAPAREREPQQQAYNNVSKSNTGDTGISGGKACEVGKFPGSAPAKVNCVPNEAPKPGTYTAEDLVEMSRKLNQERHGEEIIPAATYEPSKDTMGEESGEGSGNSNDFANQAYSILGDGAESSKTRGQVWLASCEMLNSKVLNNQPGGTLNLGKHTTRIVELEEEEKTEEHHGGLDMNKLKNPRDNIKKLRKERRWSERAAKITMMKAEEQAKMGGKKRTAEGLYNTECKEKIQEGVKMMLSFAQRWMVQQDSRRMVIQLPAPPVRDHEDQELAQENERQPEE